MAASVVQVDAVVWPLKRRETWTMRLEPIELGIRTSDDHHQTTSAAIDPGKFLYWRRCCMLRCEWSLCQRRGKADDSQVRLGHTLEPGRGGKDAPTITGRTCSRWWSEGLQQRFRCFCKDVEERGYPWSSTRTFSRGAYRMRSDSMKSPGLTDSVVRVSGEV